MVVKIGIPLHRIAIMASLRLRYKIHTYVYIMPETIPCLCQFTSLMVSHLLYLPYCTVIAGYQKSSHNSNNQQHPTADYRQTSKLLPGISQPKRVKSTTNRIWTWQFKYASTMPIVLCMSNGLICSISLAFTSTCRQKKDHVMHYVKFAAIQFNFTSTISYTISRKNTFGVKRCGQVK